MSAYPRPEAFRQQLNSLLQETRNVTWMLQTSKSKIPEFQHWYREWQQRMSDDEIMRWAVAMRNQVVKEGDLEAHSVARVTLLGSWNSPSFVDLNVPAHFSPAAVARRVSVGELPPTAAKIGVLAVERRWSVNTLPDYEVLEALAHCYGVLYELISEAHDLCQIAMADDSVERLRRTADGQEPDQGRPPRCMEISREHRTAFLRLATGELLTLGHRAIGREPDVELRLTKIMDRYGLTEAPKPIPPPTSVAELFSFAEYLVDMSKRTLMRDKTHIHIVHLISRRGIEMHVLEPVDKSEKLILYHDLAGKVARDGVMGVAGIAEAWSYRGDLNRLPDDLVDLDGVDGRGESLMVFAAWRSGEVRVWITDFVRKDDGEIQFADTKLSGREAANFLLPILAVWESQP